MTEKELISSAVKKEKVSDLFNRTDCALLLTVYSFGVADPGCFSPVPGSRFFSIPETIKQQKRGRQKNSCLSSSFEAINFAKTLQLYLILYLRKKN